jgi:hypothetical protein
MRRRHPHFGALLQLVWTDDNNEAALEIVTDSEYAFAAALRRRVTFCAHPFSSLLTVQGFCLACSSLACRCSSLDTGSNVSIFMRSVVLPSCLLAALRCCTVGFCCLALVARPLCLLALIQLGVVAVAISSWRSAESTAVGHSRFGVPPLVGLVLKPCSVAWARAFPACVPSFRLSGKIGTKSATTRAGHCGAADGVVGFVRGTACPV